MKSLYADILFKNITIISPAQSVGVILANQSTPMQNVVFEVACCCCCCCWTVFLSQSMRP